MKNTSGKVQLFSFKTVSRNSLQNHRGTRRQKPLCSPSQHRNVQSKAMASPQHTVFWWLLFIYNLWVNEKKGKKVKQQTCQKEEVATLRVEDVAWEYHPEEDAERFWTKCWLWKGLVTARNEKVSCSLMPAVFKETGCVHFLQIRFLSQVWDPWILLPQSNLQGSHF